MIDKKYLVLYIVINFKYISLFFFHKQNNQAFYIKVEIKNKRKITIYSIEIKS